MMKIIYLIIGFLFILPIVNAVTSITGCLDITIPGEYELSNAIGGNGTGMDACLIIDNVDGVHIDCKGYIVNGVSTRASIYVTDSDNFELHNCITMAGKPGGGDGIIHLDNVDYSSVYDIEMRNCSSVGGLVANRQLFLDDSNNNQINNISIDGQVCRGETLYLDSSSNNIIHDLSINNKYIPITGGGDGIYLRLASNNNTIYNIYSDLSGDSFKIQGDNNNIYNVNYTWSVFGGFVVDGDDNIFTNITSELSEQEGLEVSGNNNSFFNYLSNIDYLSGISSGALRVNGDYNYFYNLNIFNSDHDSMYINGNYNIFNYSLVPVKSVASSDSALIKLIGSNNEIFDSIFSINSTSPLFYTIGTNNKIYNNYIFTNTNDLILNKSSVSYNYWYVNKQLGDPIFPLDNNNTKIGGNWWETLSGAYGDTCDDANKDGFCDSPFVISGVNATDLYPISNKWELLGCSADTLFTELSVDPYPITDVGTYFNFTMRNSFSINITLNENCTYPNPNAISFIDCNYNDSLDIEYDFWWGEMSTSVYDGCVALGSHDCNNSQDWQDYFYLYSDTAYQVKLTCWLRDYDGAYLDVDLLRFNFTPGEMHGNITLKASNYDWNADGLTCNYFGNASVCVTAEESYNEASFPTQQPAYTCWDWDNDGIYDDAYISSGEYFYFNVSCPGAVGHAEEWNSTLCIGNGVLENVDGYAGSGNIKMLVGNVGLDALDTDTQSISIYKDDDNEIGGDVEIKINSSDLERNTTIHRKDGDGFVAFKVNWTDPLDAVTCIRFIDINILSEKVNRYCIYNDVDAKGVGDCDCSNNSVYHGIYDFEGNLNDYWYFVDYNFSRYGFEFDANVSGVEIYNQTYFKTAPRLLSIELVELSGCGDFRSYPIRYEGICQDGEWDNDEENLDYGGKCGSCFDGNLSLLIGETDIDYGGIHCGSCAEDSDASRDSSWNLARDFIISNSSHGDLMNNSYTQNWIPFKEQWCLDSEAIVGTINAMMGSMILTIILIAVGILLIIIILLAFILSFWGGFGGYLVKQSLKRKKQRKEEENNKV